MYIKEAKSMIILRIPPGQVLYVSLPRKLKETAVPKESQSVTYSVVEVQMPDTQAPKPGRFLSFS